MLLGCSDTFCSSFKLLTKEVVQSCSGCLWDSWIFYVILPLWASSERNHHQTVKVLSPLSLIDLWETNSRKCWEHKCLIAFEIIKKKKSIAGRVKSMELLLVTEVNRLGIYHCSPNLKVPCSVYTRAVQYQENKSRPYYWEKIQWQYGLQLTHFFLSLPWCLHLSPWA